MQQGLLAETSNKIMGRSGYAFRAVREQLMDDDSRERKEVEGRAKENDKANGWGALSHAHSVRVCRQQTTNSRINEVPSTMRSRNYLFHVPSHAPPRARAPSAANKNE